MIKCWFNQCCHGISAPPFLVNPTPTVSSIFIVIILFSLNKPEAKMEAGLTGNDIMALAALLRTHEEDTFDDNQKVRNVPTNSTQGTSKPKIVKPTTEESAEDKFEKQLTEEIAETDWRKTPQWNIIYKQAVTPSDLYLQMSGKTQLTSSCEDMVITIDLPGEKSAGIDVKVTSNHLDVICVKFRLSVPLPHQVDPQKGNAKWDSNTEQLILTLKMDREFDYVNF